MSLKQTVQWKKRGTVAKRSRLLSYGEIQSSARGRAEEARLLVVLVVAGALVGARGRPLGLRDGPRRRALVRSGEAPKSATGMANWKLEQNIVNYHGNSKTTL